MRPPLSRELQARRQAVRERRRAQHARRMQTIADICLVCAEIRRQFLQYQRHVRLMEEAYREWCAAIMTEDDANSLDSDMD